MPDVVPAIESQVPSPCPVAVIGSGVMGAGIAEVAARAGCEVTVVDAVEEAIREARRRIQASLERAASSSRLVEPVADILARIRFGTELSAVRDSDVVVEAIRESFDEKAALFRDVDALVGPRTLLLTNTSSIPVARLASTTAHPERFLGLHFFNPAPVMPLVEVVPSLLTEEWATVRTEEFARDVLGKRVVRAQDRSGFIVNALLVPYLLSAVRMLERALATREDIDEGMVGGCGMSMGPLRLCDLIGLDTLVLVAESLYDEHLDPAYAPPPLLRRYVDAGWLGRKSGRGFYSYETARGHTIAP